METCRIVCCPPNSACVKTKNFRLIYKRGRENVHPLAVLYVMRRAWERLGCGLRLDAASDTWSAKSRATQSFATASSGDCAKPPACCCPLSGRELYDLVFVGRGRMKTATWPEVQEAVRVLLRRGGVLTEAVNRETAGREAE